MTSASLHVVAHALPLEGMVTSLDTNVHPSRSINDMQINNCQHATGKDLPVCKSNNVSTMTMAYTHASLQH